jgi:hypothetical protein
LALSFSSLSFGFGNRGNLIASGGFGLTINPTYVLISPQLEYVSRPHFFFGPLAQLALGDGGVLLTTTATARVILGTHPHLKPSFEGGIGLAFASGSFSGNNVGVAIHGGMGFDYQIDASTAVGTMLRVNFAPPIKSFFISWPLIIGRFLL